HGRGAVGPAPAVLVVRDDDRGVVPVRAAADRVDELVDVILARGEIGVSRVLVVEAVGLDERHGGKLPGPQGRYKVLLILQVLGLRRGAVRIIREVDERLVVELEPRPRLPGDRVVPTTRIT